MRPMLCRFYFLLETLRARASESVTSRSVAMPYLSLVTLTQIKAHSSHGSMR